MSSTRKPSTLRRLAGLMGQHAPLVAGALACAVVVTVSTLELPVLTGDAVDLMLGPGQVDFAGLRSVLARMALAICVTALSTFLLSELSNRVVYALVHDLRVASFDKLQVLPLSYLDGHASGDVVSRVVTDIEQLSQGLLLGFQQFFTSVLTIVLTLVFMLSMNVGITLVVVVLTPVSMLVAGFIARKSYVHFREQTERRGAMTALVGEMLEGAPTVRLYDRQDEVAARFCEVDEALGQATFRAVFFSSATNPSTRFVNSLVYAGVGVFGALAAIRGALTVGGLSAFLAYANQYTKPFNDISNVVSELQSSLACAERVFELLDQEQITPDVPGARVLEEAEGSVVLQDVEFSYTPDVPLIRDLSVDAWPGHTIAIVGPTGCGKTTLINLLMRFYDVRGGSICVDGTDVRELQRASLRASWGMVLQDAWIANGTVHENIALGKPDATREEVVAAAREAFADGFIRRLPQGYDTVLEADGNGLSAGQRQLICIARIMLARPAMLILDEATSSIDTRTELRVQAAVGKLMEGRTSFVVAHRLSTIQNADLICVMRDGRIVERGNHEQLLEAGGFYKQLYESQFDPD